MIKEKIKNITLYALGFAVILIILWLILKFALPVLLPFILAYALSYALRRGAEGLAKITRMNKKVLMALLLLLGLSGIAAFIWFGATAIYREISEALTFFSGALGGGIIGKLQTILQSFGERLGIGEELEGALSQLLSETASQISSYAAGMAAKMISALPSLAFGGAVGAASLFYFTFGYEKACNAVKRLLPEKQREIVKGYVGSAMRGLGRFARAYSAIIAVTFTELLVGFMILRVEHSFAFAALISVVDILPILGVGTVLVPWALGSLLTGNAARAAGLLILLAVIWIVRQPVEAKLIGKGAGVHPVFALMAVYAGYRLAGVFGMIAAPTILTALAVILEERKGMER